MEKAGSRLPSVYESNQTPLYKYLVLLCLEKILCFADEADIKNAIDPNSLALFLSKLTESNDIMIIAITLQILEVVCPKLPHMFTALAREGLIEFVTKLTDPDVAQKLEATFIGNKKAQTQNTASKQQSSPSKRNISPQMLQNLASFSDEDPRYDTLLNYIQNLNLKFSGTTNPQSTQPYSYLVPSQSASLDSKDEKQKSLSGSKKSLDKGKFVIASPKG